MTTSHRATYRPAKGREGQGGYKSWKESRQVSVLMMPSYTKLKKRHFEDETVPQKNPEELKRDLENKEKKLSKKKGENLLMLTDGEKRKGKRVESVEEKVYRDEDEDDDSDSDEELDDDSDSDSDDEEEERLLLQELEKLKKEKEQKEKEERMKRKMEETKEIINSNPLLRQESNDDDKEGSLLVKRKWNEFSVFRNQALKNEEFEPAKKKRFVNDTIRNEFHKGFLKKFIK